MEAPVVVEKTGADPGGAGFTSDGKGGRVEGISEFRISNFELRIYSVETSTTEFGILNCRSESIKREVLNLENAFTDRDGVAGMNGKHGAACFGLALGINSEEF